MCHIPTPSSQSASFCLHNGVLATVLFFFGAQIAAPHCLPRSPPLRPSRTNQGPFRTLDKSDGPCPPMCWNACIVALPEGLTQPTFYDPNMRNCPLNVGPQPKHVAVFSLLLGAAEFFSLFEAHASSAPSKLGSSPTMRSWPRANDPEGGEGGG